MSAVDFVKQIRAGISIGNTLDATDDRLKKVDPPEKFETAWHNPVIREELIEAILEEGFNLIRIPVSWRNHLGDGPDFAIEKSWLDRVQEVVDYAYRKNAYVILNLHHEDWNYPYYEKQEEVCAKMRAVWSQIADCFADYDERLIFEAQNEPRKVGTPLEWNGGDREGWDVVNASNFAFVETIRGGKGKNPERYLMLPGYAANCTEGIRHIELPENDDRIIVSVHAYEPYEFALQMPGRVEWNRDTEAIDRLMEELKTRYTGQGVPVIIGEFGAMEKEGNINDRTEWAEYYVNAAAKIGVPCVWWDNGLFQGKGERFGLFDRYDFSCVYPQIAARLTFRKTRVS
ncbi:MAG: glycoside hydrolase family 5 protein [bacterium]|nr:glycoside hydrolase family 5 protein [bacterium]